MPSLERQTAGEGAWKSIRKHLNFYRVHILFFTFTPLIFSGIFYASNGEYHISYIDALFNCVSAMTVCGLATVNLSSLTAWQQAILFVQMCLGSPVVVSWVMVYIRRHYFAKKFQYIVEAEAARRLERLETRRLSRLETDSETVDRQSWPRRIATLLRRRTGLSTVEELSEDEPTSKERKAKSVLQKLRPDMIRRMDDAPKLVNPSGWISEGDSNAARKGSITEDQAESGTPLHDSSRQLAFADQITSSPQPATEAQLPFDDSTTESDVSSLHSTRAPQPRRPGPDVRRLSDPGSSYRRSSNTDELPMQRFDTVNVGTVQHRDFARTQTVEFAPVPRHAHTGSASRGRGRDRSSERGSVRPSDRKPSEDARSPRGAPLQSYTTNQTQTNRSQRAKHENFGGFPMPHEIVSDVFRRFFPNVERTLTRTLTVPVASTIASQHHSAASQTHVKQVPYISFDAVVGRNSTFQMLTNEQLEELGGVEYRALNALLWLVAGYHFGVQLISFIVIAPYMSINRWKDDFLPPQEFRPIPSVWFSAFQVVSSYTNTGMSLVDQSMVPFQTAYPVIIFMIILILAGNTAFPVFLRFTIWTITKLIPRESRLNETLHFLLDHPRRCFIYLFPSHQTWFLLTILVGLNCTDWFFFMVLDIGNPAITTIPLGTRFIIGLLQAVAVRAAGFGTVVLSALAPAVKVLYVVMMYISIYPIALSVRSTNVYEEQSLGVFQDEEDTDDEEEGFQPTGSRVTIWSRYLAMHARRQLAFDMWWLGLALFLVCIIERGNIDDEANQGWFNIFSIVFELVSAYGTVGLSLGIPTQNYSFSGAFRPLSKLIVCAVMLRGRHRGLPVAIDRAVMLPAEFTRTASTEEKVPRRRSSRSTFPTFSTTHASMNYDNDASSERRRRNTARRGSTQEDEVEEFRRRAARADAV